MAPTTSCTVKFPSPPHGVTTPSSSTQTKAVRRSALSGSASPSQAPPRCSTTSRSSPRPPPTTIPPSATRWSQPCAPCTPACSATWITALTSAALSTTCWPCRLPASAAVPAPRRHSTKTFPSASKNSSASAPTLAPSPGTPCRPAPHPKKPATSSSTSPATPPPLMARDGPPISGTAPGLRSSPPSISSSATSNGTPAPSLVRRSTTPPPTASGPPKSTPP